MNCNQVRDNLSSFIDTELDGDQTNAIKAHLIRCKDCREQRDLIENMGHKIRKLSPLTAPADFQFRVYSAIRRKESSKKTSPFRKWQTAILTSAAMLLGVFIGVGSNSFIPAIVSVPTNTKQIDSSVNTEPVSTMLASDTQVLNEDSLIRNYTLDSYVRHPLVPVNVTTIPDDPNSIDLNNPETSTHTADYTQDQPQYVLDNIPMRVSYERTIY